MEPVNTEHVQRMNKEDAESAAIASVFQDLTEMAVRQANVDLIRRACNRDACVRMYLAELKSKTAKVLTEG